MIDPLFWLGLSILLVAVSLTAVLIAAIPALQELARAARSAEKLFDTLSRELPPTLNSIRTTGMEITDLTDDVSEGVKSATQVVQQVDQSLDGAKKQAQNVQIGTRSIFVGVKAAWKTFTRQKSPRRQIDRLSPGASSAIALREREAKRQRSRNDNGYNDPASWDFDDEDSLPQSTAAEDWSDQE
ncbi:MAG: DUF948 domain-containing protein [Hassallia sp.]